MSSGETNIVCWADSAPARPANSPEKAKAPDLNFHMVTPSARILSSFSRMPQSVRPNPDVRSQAAAA